MVRYGMVWYGTLCPRSQHVLLYQVYDSYHGTVLYDMVGDGISWYGMV